MFTGIIENVGTIEKITKKDGGVIFTIRTFLAEEKDLHPGDSVSINGACHTLIEQNLEESTLSFFSSALTLSLTNLGTIAKGDIVNLERALLVSSRLSGHMVQGHIEGQGVILAKSETNSDTRNFEIGLNPNMMKYIIAKGSICLDGISLTVADKKKDSINVLLIPETISRTNAKYWKVEKKINIETDMIAKYVENFMGGYHS